jgi:hypothetical protein
MTKKGPVLFDEEGTRGNHPMPAPHFVQPNTGVASDIGESLTMGKSLTSLRMKSENVTKDLNSGITHGGDS